jgi:type IV pilus assembly protein PilY1
MNAMLPRTTRVIAIAGWLALAPPCALAEDIDIFGRPPSSNELPNVLIIWDSSANWSASISVPNCYFYDDGVQTTDGPKPTSPNKEQGTKFAIEKCAIYNVIDALQPLAAGPDTPRFNIGLMLFNESGAPQGGYPRQQFVPLTRANAAVFKARIKAITIGDDKANNGPYAQALYEAYLMFAKKAPYQGTLGTKWDHAAVASNLYVGAPGSGCGTNNIIFISNGSPNENNTQSLALLQAAGGNTSLITYPPGRVTNSDQNDWADEFARFLRGVDVVAGKEGVQSIVTHAVAVVGASSDGLYPNFINGIATQGGGQYKAASDITELKKFLLNIFNSIEAANSVFASASLPVSVNTQGTYKNQVFVGMFRPDKFARPRWLGNLKEYKIVYDPVTDQLSMGDRLGNPAINAATGFFDPSATSYWTTDSTFWINDPKGTPKTVTDEPDGEVVEKGAAAEMLRIKYAASQDARPVYTCVSCSSGTTLAAASANRFEVANSAITAAMLGTIDPANPNERADLINWVRGTDNKGDELGPGGTTTVRPSVHGDVLHSRPAVVDYGGSIGTIVFYGSNDGMLRAIDGNQTGATGGQELWAFVPSELYGRFKRLRDNIPEITFPVTPPSAVTLPRDYFVDGSITVYQKLDSSRNTERVIIFVTMRRGGRFLYAFDVTTPASPIMLWRKSNADIPVLAQTWSDPRVTLVKGRSNPVLVMGAGYDAAAEDATSPGVTTMGNAVLVLDALTGDLLKTMATERPVPAAVALLDSDFDGYTDRAYAVDMGANVYRIEFENAAGDGDAGNWKIAKFAALGDTARSRKFFFAPDLVQTRLFTGILVGSGDREKPLAPQYPSGSITNDRFYTLLDYATGKGVMPSSVIGESQLVPAGGSTVLASSGAGCYLPLVDSSRGEKVVTGAVSTGGYTYFSTNTPSDTFSTNSCDTHLGTARAYRLALFCGAAESLELVGGGLPPTPVTGLVEVQVPSQDPNAQDPEKKQVPFIIGGFNAQLSGLQASKVPINVDPTRRRTFWFTSKRH